MKIEHITHQPKSKTHEIPILLIHGLWHGAWCWDDGFMERLAEQGYEVHALSWRGHAQSEGRIFGSRAKDYISDVEKVIADIGTTPILIGHSAGGFVTQHICAKRDDIPAAITLAAAPPFGVWDGMLQVALKQPLAFLVTNLTVNLGPLVSTPEQARWAFFSDSMPDEDVTRYHAKMDSESYRMFLDMLLLNLPSPQRVTNPLLVMGGEADTVIREQVVRKTAEKYGKEAVIFPGMAHDMMLDSGWEDVVEHIVGWLGEQGY